MPGKQREQNIAWFLVQVSTLAAHINYNLVGSSQHRHDAGSSDNQENCWLVYNLADCLTACMFFFFLYNWTLKNSGRIVPSLQQLPL